MQFAIGDTDFLLDGSPFRVLSGALHYFRVHPGQWADRIHKARLMGLNTIETYVAWNAHASSPDSFALDGGLDLGHFLDLVAAEGMYAIVRPGPYICAEWTNGGLPAWLPPHAQVRSSDPAYLSAVAGYFDRLAPVLVPRQANRGGPVILVQVENEYGAYGCDKDYLRALVKLLRGTGVTVPLITVDQPSGTMLADGSLPELLATGSFGSHAAERLATLRAHQPDGPLMCSEFWNGWFDSWGGRHHVTSAPAAAAELDTLLRMGASVNVYMFHGGTNYGLTSGANDKGTYAPIVTSYDYDAPLDEAGHPTEKFWAFRDVIARYAPVPAELPPGPAPAPAFSAPVRQVVPLWDVLDRLGAWHASEEPVSADELGQFQGLTLYQADIGPQGDDPVVLSAAGIRDRAQVFVNRQPAGVLARDHHDRALTLPAVPGGEHGTLELLVEDQGRVNYGPRIGEPKGLTGPVTVNGAPLRGWRVMPLPLTDIGPVAGVLRDRPAHRAGNGVPGPGFARVTFGLDAPADLFLSTAGLGKGIAWLNGFCLGRYWSRGPQRTLYVPHAVTRTRQNELIFLELGAMAGETVDFVAGPELGHTES